MKIRLVDILNSKDILNKLASIKLEDGVTSFKLAHNSNKINPELIAFEKIKEDLIITYGEKKEGDIIEVPQKNRDEYNKQIIKLLEQELELDILLIDPAKISGISPGELMPVEWLFKLEV